MKYFIIFIMIVFFTSLVYGQDSDEFNLSYPDTPSVAPINLRSIITQKITNNPNGKKKIDNSKTTELFVYEVSVVFYDNSVLKGIVSFPENSIRISHTKDGFLFEKSIQWNDVKSVKLIEWRPAEESKERDPKAKVILYYFYPSIYQITMKKGEKYEYKNNISYLNKLLLTNNDGSASIYSFFVDYWNVTGDKTGYWKNAKSTYFYAPVKNPLKKIIKFINFK